MAIGDFIARDNPVRAVSYIAALRAKCQLLAVFPQSAPIRPSFGVGVRMSVFGRYLILYVVHGDTLEIRRVVYGARDFTEGNPLA